MSFWDRLRHLFGDRTCQDCQGRGQWQAEVTTPDGMTTVETYYCETCHGRGFITNEDDLDDFDLAGSGVTEYDEDD